MRKIAQEFYRAVGSIGNTSNKSTNAEQHSLHTHDGSLNSKTEPETKLSSTKKPVTEQLTETPTNITPLLCEPCKSQQKDECAHKFCPECDELLCINCCEIHKVLKATRSHVLKEADLLKRDPRANQQDASAVHQPGRTSAIDIGTEKIKISWLAPKEFNEEGYYQISYKKHTSQLEWRVYEEKCKHNTAVLTNLDPNSEYVFRIRVVCGEFEGPYSEVSDVIKTLPSAASRLVAFSVPHDSGNTSPKIYALPIEEMRNSRNIADKTRHFEVGSCNDNTNTEKTIMVIGETGAGKSTLVDGMVNYILGVNWSDNIRFTIVNLEHEEKERKHNQALSQTEWITCYTIHHDVGNRIPFTLNIIDTPGFGDTRGIDRDKAIVKQLKGLFEASPPKGILTIDAICFLVKAPDSRLTATQVYIFESIMSLFGKDVEKNICSLITFADGKPPAVYAALDESKLSFGKRFTFNNSALFSENMDSDVFTAAFWKMGMTSFMLFFQHLETLQSVSIQLTRHVLNERSRLEATVSNFTPKLEAGLVHVNKLEELIINVDKNKAIIEKNKNFEIMDPKIVQRLDPLPKGQHTTNCLHCQFTCHENCAYANNDEKRNCIAMDERGNCKNCPDKCLWTKHANTPNIIVYETVMVPTTYENKKKDYEKAHKENFDHETLLASWKNELKSQIQTVDDMMRTIVDCHKTLEKIALRPNPLNITDYINKMISNEESKKKPGYLDRIKSLEGAKERAEVVNEARNALGASTSNLSSGAIKNLFERAKKFV